MSGRTVITELRQRALDWHLRRFPNATMERTAMKLGEEVGELMAALIGSTGSEHPERAEKIGEEAADVFGVLMGPDG